MTRPRSTEEEIAREIARLFELDRPACLHLWRTTIGGPPPRHVSLLLLRKTLAYDLQARAFGDLPAKARRVLEGAAGKAPSRPGRTIRPGARLIREWNGRSHEVEVLADGYAWKGRRFRSLSAIAREITGARWSGPRFFGIKG